MIQVMVGTRTEIPKDRGIKGMPGDHLKQRKGFANPSFSISFFSFRFHHSIAILSSDINAVTGRFLHAANC